MAEKTFKQKTITGLKWNTLSRGLSQITALIVGIILARLLSPEEFGLIGMVTVLTGFTNVFVDFGFASAIIQNKKSNTKHWSSVFWLNLLLSLFFAIILTLVSPLIASFYDKPVLEIITKVIAWTFFFQAFNLVQQALMKKSLRFKEITIIQVSSQVIAGVIAIIAACQGYSYWSLVIKLYITIIITNIGLWYVTNWRPKWLFDKSALKELLDFTLPLMGTQALNYWTRNADYLMIGKMLGDTALGVYTRAYTLMLSPLQNISRVISGVMFPAYSLIQDDKVRIKNIYLQVTRMIAFLTFPAMFGICVVAEPLILLLLGDKWEAVIPVIQILAPLGASQSIGTLNGNIFLSQGETKLQFKIGGIARLIIIFSLFVGIINGGLLGIAWAYLGSALCMSFVMYYFMGKLINLKIKDILNNLSRIFFASLLMAVLVAAFDHFLTNDWSNLTRLITLVVFGGFIYAFFVWLFKIKELSMLVTHLKNK